MYTLSKCMREGGTKLMTVINEIRGINKHINERVRETLYV